MKFEVSVGRIVAVLMFLYPLVLLSIRSGTNVCFAALIVLALFKIITEPGLFLGDINNRTIYWFCAAMASLFVANLISQLYHWTFRPAGFDGASRFLFAIPIYFLLRKVPTRYLAVVECGFIAGALSTIVIAMLHPPFLAFLYPHGGGRLGTNFVNPIHFGDIALVLGLMAGMSINWGRSDSYGMVALKTAGLLGGTNASLLSGSRGGWLAIPVVFAVWAWLMARQIPRSAIGLGFAGLIVAMVGLYVFAAPVSDRINSLVAEFSTLNTNMDNDSGLRLQIWNAALHLFAQNPIFGIGPDQFANFAPELGREGYLTTTGVMLAKMEVHNEILVHAVSLGIFGLAAILLIYFVPLVFFLRAARSSDRVRRGAGVLGACFVVSFFMFGLTVETFDLKMTATFYSLTVAVLLAIATNSAASADVNVS